MMCGKNGVKKPDWWRENEAIKSHFDLPPYKPSRFLDGRYTFQIIQKLENIYDCKIQFIGINTNYGENWEVRIDGETAFEINRERDDKGNTVYNISSEEFKIQIENNLSRSH